MKTHSQPNPQATKQLTAQSWSRGFHPDRHHIHWRGWNLGIHDKNFDQIVCATRSAGFLARNFTYVQKSGENFALASAAEALRTNAAVVQLER